jgi:hypothetical protein
MAGMNTTHVPQPVRLIRPTAVYLRGEVCRLLRVRPSTLRREIAEGRLRVSKRAGRYYFLGEWLLEWLRSGEVLRNPQKG